MTTTVPATLFMVPPARAAELPWDVVPGDGGVQHRVLFEDGRTVAGLLRFHAGAEELKHIHVDGEHHLWVLEGGVTVDDTFLPSGSYLHVPAGLMHRVSDPGGGSLLFYVFTGSLAPRLRDER